MKTFDALLELTTQHHLLAKNLNPSNKTLTLVNNARTLTSDMGILAWMICEAVDLKIERERAAPGPFGNEV